MSSTTSLNAAIALTRFGLGARPGEMEAVGDDARGWLAAQIRPGGAPLPQGDLPTTDERVQDWLAYQQTGQQRRQTRRQEGMAPETASQAAAMAQPMAEGAATSVMAQQGQTSAQTAPMSDEAQAAFDARRESRRDLAQETAREFVARADLGATTPDGFAERWALFWANAFTVSATKFQSGVFIGPYEREAIRPHVFGRFEDLVLAAESHPAMLTYLDQAQSVGPNSVAGQRRNAGLNENLAREILELHTLGTDGGYTQADVTELARALTGWSVPTNRGGGGQGQGQGRRGRRAAALAEPESENGFVFRAIIHEPGTRTVLGKTYAEGGVEQGRAILRDLAAGTLHPRDAKRRLAREIVAMWHGREAAAAAERAFDEVFVAGGLPEEIPEVRLAAPGGPDAVAHIVRRRVVPLLVEVGLARSHSEARRLVVQGGVAVDGQRVTEPEAEVAVYDGAVLRVGKRRFVRVRLVAG